jgi:hypothetical protein
MSQRKLTSRRDCVNRVLAYLSLAVDAYARGTTPEAVERKAHPVLWRLGKAAHKQNGGRE